jgi:hypothetical protein
MKTAGYALPSPQLVLQDSAADARKVAADCTALFTAAPTALAAPTE